MLNPLVAAGILLAANYAAAQSTPTFSHLVPNNMTGTTVVSVIGANPTGTTYAFGCPPETSCYLRSSATYTVGASTLEVTLTHQYPLSISCAFTGTTRAVCVSRRFGSDVMGAITSTVSDLAYWTLLVTAGAELLPKETESQTATQTATQTAAQTTTGSPSNSAGAPGGLGEAWIAPFIAIVTALLVW